MAFRWPWAKTTRVVCPDGSIRFIHQNIDDAFPLAFRDTKSKAKALAKGLKGLEASAEGEHSDQLSQILYRIDEKNSSLQVNFRASYVVYQVAPCDNLQYFNDAVRNIQEWHNELTFASHQLDQIAVLGKKSDDLVEYLNEVLPEIFGRLGRPAEHKKIADQMKSVPEKTKDWKGDE